jgi:hypothetical protein
MGDYADLRIMPIWPVKLLVAALPVVGRSA